MGDFERLYNKALRFLSFRPRSEKEIRDRLKIKYQSFDKTGTVRSPVKLRTNIKNLTLVIEKVIAKLKVQNFLNDEEFAKWWIEQRTSFRPRSLRLIKLELRQKGITDEVIESGIRNQELGIESDLDRAKKLVEIRIKRFRNPSTPLKAGKFGMTREELYQKIGGFLARRGFDWETIKQSIDYVQFHERS